MSDTDTNPPALRMMTIKGSRESLVSNQALKTPIKNLLPVTDVAYTSARIYLEGGKHRDFPPLRMISPPWNFKGIVPRYKA